MQSLSSITDSFRRYKDTFSNFWKVMLRTKLNKFPIVGELRNGKSINLYNKSSVWITSFGIENYWDSQGEFIVIKHKSNELKFRGIELNGEIPEVFGTEDYGGIDYTNKVVIDVGANIGDSSVYFIVNGAKLVYAIEPFVFPFRFLKQNIELNNMEDKIVPLNIGLWNKAGHISIDSEATTTTGKGLTKVASGPVIPVSTIEQILSDYFIENPVLKIDCEGCEYAIFNGISQDTMDKLNLIIIEYHNGKESIQKILEKTYDLEIREKNKKVGIIVAKKKGINCYNLISSEM